MGIEGLYLNIIKATYDDPTANITFNGESLQVFRNKTRMPTLTILIQHIVLEVQATAVMQEK